MCKKTDYKCFESWHYNVRSGLLSRLHVRNAAHRLEKMAAVVPSPSTGLGGWKTGGRLLEEAVTSMLNFVAQARGADIIKPSLLPCFSLTFPEIKYKTTAWLHSWLHCSFPRKGFAFCVSVQTSRGLAEKSSSALGRDGEGGVLPIPSCLKKPISQLNYCQ